MLYLHVTSVYLSQSDYLLATRLCSFGTLWIVDLKSGRIREVIEGMDLLFSLYTLTVPARH